MCAAPLLNPCRAYARAAPRVHVPRPCRAHAAPMPALAVFHALAGILASRTAIPLLVLHHSSALLLYARLLHALLFLLARLFAPRRLLQLALIPIDPATTLGYGVVRKGI